MSTLHHPLAAPPAVARGELVYQRLGASQRGFWPQARDEGTSIEGRFLGTLPYWMPSRRRPVVLLEGLKGQPWYVPLTKELARDVRRLRVGAHVRFSFLGMRRNGHRDYRRIAVARLINGTNGA